MFIPDVIAEHSLRAIGVTDPGETSRVRSEAVFKRVKSILTTRSTQTSPEITYVDWRAEVETSPEYMKQLDYITKLFDTSEQFRKDTLEIRDFAMKSLWKLHISLIKKESSSSVVTSEEHPLIDLIEGAKHILKEYAFFLALPSIYNGFDRFVLVHHHRFELLENLINGVYDNNVHTSMAFFVVD